MKEKYAELQKEEAKKGIFTNLGKKVVYYSTNSVRYSAISGIKVTSIKTINRQKL